MLAANAAEPIEAGATMLAWQRVYGKADRAAAIAEIREAESCWHRQEGVEVDAEEELHLPDYAARASPCAIWAGLATTRASHAVATANRP